MVRLAFTSRHGFKRPAAVWLPALRVMSAIGDGGLGVECGGSAGPPPHHGFAAATGEKAAGEKPDADSGASDCDGATACSGSGSGGMSADGADGTGGCPAGREADSSPALSAMDAASSGEAPEAEEAAPAEVEARAAEAAASGESLAEGAKAQAEDRISSCARASSVPILR